MPAMAVQDYQGRVDSEPASSRGPSVMKDGEPSSGPRSHIEIKPEIELARAVVAILDVSLGAFPHSG